MREGLPVWRDEQASPTTAAGSAYSRTDWNRDTGVCTSLTQGESRRRPYAYAQPGPRVETDAGAGSGQPPEDTGFGLRPRQGLYPRGVLLGQDVLGAERRIGGDLPAGHHRRGRAGDLVAPQQKRPLLPHGVPGHGAPGNVERSREPDDDPLVGGGRALDHRLDD